MGGFKNWYSWGCVLGALLLSVSLSVAGEDEDAEENQEKTLETMTVEELREYQAYFFPGGGRDPFTMRRPTSSELGQGGSESAKKIPTLEEMERELIRTLDEVNAAILAKDYATAIKSSETLLFIVDNEWPEVKADQVNLLRMIDDLRNFNRMATRLKMQEDITAEFRAMHLRVDGVIWSPTDAKAVVNGKTLSAGEIMLSERRQGDLRIEIIEEHGVVFQFKDMRFRIPVEIYAPLVGK